MVRSADLLVARFELVNLRRSNTKHGARLVRARIGQPAYVVVHFPPQTIAEETLRPIPESLPERMGLWSGGPSRLVFRLPEKTRSLPLRLDALLDWDSFEPVVTRRARPPALLQTAIELPFRVILSPHEDDDWHHRIEPHVVERDGIDRVALWFTRLGRADTGLPTARVIHAREPVRARGRGFPRDGTLPLTSDERRQLVLLTTRRGPVPSRGPIALRRMMLSALGGWLTAEGVWEYDDTSPANQELGLKLLGWSHAATMGRDQYVRVVTVGYLLPFGHRAAKITVSERTFRAGPSESRAAYLVKTEFLVVLERERRLRNTGSKIGGVFIDQQMPFARVALRTLVTPPLSGSTTARFWPKVDGRDFRFSVQAWDLAGAPCEFELPMFFVATRDGEAAAEYAKGLKEQRTARLGLQPVALAPPARPGDTTVQVNAMRFVAVGPKAAPVMEKADVAVPALARLVGVGETAEATYHSDYLKVAGGFTDGNSRQLFLNFTKPIKVNFDGQADRAGALITPNMGIDVLSRSMGAIALKGPTPNASSAVTSPNAALKSVRILGGISLADIVPDGVRPTIVTYVAAGYDVTEFSWNVNALQSSQSGRFLSLEEGTLDLCVKVRTPVDKTDSPPDLEVRARLDRFGINFGGVIGVNFGSLSFAAGAQLKPQVLAEGVDVIFDGALKFLNPLKDLIPSDGFNNPPTIDVTADGVRAGYTLELPDVPIGAYALHNISFGAGLAIPFTGQPARARFHFAERSSPFLLTVSGFTGGGFVAIAAGLDGVEEVEASIEFGGSVAINVGVASGGVAVMAGVYICVQKTGPSLTLAAYFRATGALEFLGIIAITTEIYIGLEYREQGKNKSFWGRATVSVEVEVAFFSKTVSFSAEREFAGSASDPPFLDMVSAEDFLTYFDALAPD